MATTYSIRATRGAYIREQHRTATDADVRDVLERAAEYLGHPAACVVRSDEGNYVAYEDAEHEAADIGQGGSADPILVAQPIEER